jgi:uncharacterized membrane protein
LLIGAFLLISQYGYSSAQGKGWGAALSIGPVALIAVFFAWRWLPRWAAVATTALVAFLLVHYWTFLKTHYEWSDLVQQAGAFAMLAIGFGRSLLPGRIPTCSQLAIQQHGPLYLVEIVYLRRATAVWGVFYGVLAIAVVALFFATTPRLWSLFLNFGTFGLIGLVFVVDHAIRRRVLPRRPGGGMFAALLHSIGGGGRPT